MLATSVRVSPCSARSGPRSVGSRDEDLTVLLLDCHALRHDLAQLALRPVHGDATGIDRDGDAGGHFDWLFSDTTHRSYQTKQMTSPPMPSFSAVRLVITPRDVDRIAVPMPPRTRGRRSLPA